MGSSPALDQNFFVQFFFGFVRLFFANISKGSTVIFLFILQKMDVQSLPECPLLQVSALCDLPETKKKIKKLKKFGFFLPIFPQAGTVEENT